MSARGLRWSATVPVLLCVLASSCERSIEPPPAVDVEHLSRHPSRIHRVRGTVAELASAHQLSATVRPRVEEGSPFPGATLPWPAVPGTLRIEDEAGRELVACTALGELDLSPSAFLHLPAVETLGALEMRTARGRVDRAEQGGPEPSQLWLESTSDFLELQRFQPGPSCTWTLWAHGGEKAAELQVQLDEEPPQRLVVAEHSWNEFTFESNRPPGLHRIRIQLPDAVPNAARAVGLLALRRELPTGDHLLFSPGSTQPLHVHALAQQPAPLETRALNRQGRPAATFLFLGGPTVLSARGDFEQLELLGQRFTAQELLRGKDLTGAITAGFHSLHLSGQNAEVTVSQPWCALTSRFLHPDTRLQDYLPTPETAASSSVPPALLARVLSRLDLQGDRRTGLWLPSGSTLDYRVELAGTETLRFAVGVTEPPAQNSPEAVFARVTGTEHLRGGSSGFQVEWRPDQGEPVVLASIPKVREGPPWQDHEIALEGRARGSGSLRFASRATEGSAPVSLGVGDPRLLRPRREARERPNLLLYVIDTLRADRLSCYGGATGTTPFLDRLAREGFRFEQFQSVASWTRPTVATILTGLYPTWHGVDNRHRLPDAPVTLAEALSAAGVSTWAVVTNPHVAAAEMHFHQGFDRFVGLEQSRALDELVTSEQIQAVVSPWLDHNSAEPFFLYLHSMDPHAPYLTHRDLERPAGDDYRGPLAGRRLFPHGDLADRDLEDADVRYVLDVYTNEVRYQDRMLERLFEDLQRRGLAQDTVLVVLGDHGEEFREHGGWAHGKRMWEELLRVPLIVWIPERWRQRGGFLPRLIPTPVSQVDVTPSLLDLLGVADPFPRQGQSFVSLLQGVSGAPRPLLAEESLHRDTANLGALRSGRYKLIWSREEPEDEIRWLLYDLEEDPREQKNLAAQRPDLVEQLRRERDQLLSAAAAVSSEVHAAPVQVSDAVRRQLEELGYVVEEEGEADSR